MGDEVTQNVIHVRATRAQVRQMVAQLPAILSGKASDPTGLVQGMQLLIGVAALSLIKLAFIAKSRGGTDEAGDSWQSLSPRYVAYGRRHPGLAGKRNDAKAKGRAGRPLLTDKQDARWRQLYAQKLHQTSRTQRRLSVGGDSGRQAKSAAAAYAWAVLKAEGGKTIFGEYAGAPVEILRDTGVLFNSLSPGVDGPSGAPNQVFRTVPGGVIVGTNRKGAARHHNGGGKAPQRRLWPDPSRWPGSWWAAISAVGRDGAMRILTRMLGG